MVDLLAVAARKKVCMFFLDDVAKHSIASSINGMETFEKNKEL